MRCVDLSRFYVVTGLLFQICLVLCAYYLAITDPVRRKIDKYSCDLSQLESLPELASCEPGWTINFKELSFEKSILVCCSGNFKNDSSANCFSHVTDGNNGPGEEKEPALMCCSKDSPEAEIQKAILTFEIVRIENMILTAAKYNLLFFGPLVIVMIGTIFFMETVPLLPLLRNGEWEDYWWWWQPNPTARNDDRGRRRQRQRRVLDEYGGRAPWG